MQGHGQTLRNGSVSDFEVWSFRIPPCQMLVCVFFYAYTPEEGRLLSAVLIGELALCLYQDSGQTHRAYTFPW